MEGGPCDEGGYDAAPDADATSDAVVDGDAVDACTGSWADLRSACNPTYGGALDAGCGAHDVEVARGTCGASLVFYSVVGASYTECFYDPGSGSLVGVVLEDDIPDWCNHTSHTIKVGQVDPACEGPGTLPATTCDQ